MNEANRSQEEPDADTVGDESAVEPPEKRRALIFVSPPHPALLDDERLLSQCDLRVQRRSGPGGQHRNKTSSGAFLTHRSTGIVVEATERRSQAVNRAVALQRLRQELAVRIRTPSTFDGNHDPDEHQIRQSYYGTNLRIGESNPAKAGVIALLINDLHATGGQIGPVARSWRVNSSAIVRLLKSHRTALTVLNQIRQHHGRKPLR